VSSLRSQRPPTADHTAVSPIDASTLRRPGQQLPLRQRPRGIASAILNGPAPRNVTPRTVVNTNDLVAGIRKITDDLSTTRRVREGPE
jgi:hypothetical protein